MIWASGTEAEKITSAKALGQEHGHKLRNSPAAQHGWGKSGEPQTVSGACLTPTCVPEFQTVFAFTHVLQRILLLVQHQLRWPRRRISTNSASVFIEQIHCRVHYKEILSILMFTILIQSFDLCALFGATLENHRVLVTWTVLPPRPFSPTPRTDVRGAKIPFLQLGSWKT